MCQWKLFGEGVEEEREDKRWGDSNVKLRGIGRFEGVSHSSTMWLCLQTLHWIQLAAVFTGGKIMAKCSIGENLNQNCDELHYIRTRGRISFSSLCEDDQFRLASRTGSENITDICLHHKRKYLNWYEIKQAYCCNPWKKHRKRVLGRGSSITIEMAKTLNLVPGKSLTSTKLPKFSQIADQ